MINVKSNGQAGELASCKVEHPTDHRASLAGWLVACLALHFSAGFSNGPDSSARLLVARITRKKAKQQVQKHKAKSVWGRVGPEGHSSCRKSGRNTPIARR